MQLKGLLFDKDGTLIHFAETWGPAVLAVMQQQTKGDAALLRRLADALDFDLEHEGFRPGASFVAGTWVDYGPPWAAALGVENTRAFEDATNVLLSHACVASLKPVGNPAEVLGELAGLGIHLGVATNDVEFAARAQCRALNLENAFDFIAGCDSGHGAKPEPGMIHAFAVKTNLAEAQIGLVGDSIHDMQAAKNAGAIAIAVLTGPAGREELAPHADYVLGSIAELPALVERLNAISAEPEHLPG